MNDPDEAIVQCILELVEVVAHADYIRSHYKQLCNDGSVYSVDDYIDIIADKSGFTIDVTEESWNSLLARGACLKFMPDHQDPSAKIGIAEHKDNDPVHGVTLCEQRFIAVKEASHLIIDGEDAFIDDCAEFIDELIDDVLLIEVGKGVRSDFFYGRVFAMELLFPWEYRDQAIAEVRSKKKKPLDVATEFMIPEKELLWFIRPGIHSELSKIHDIYDQTQAKLGELYGGSKS